MSSGSPNCSGFTKMLTATTSHSARARVISEVCPSCSAPMVGTSPTTPPVERARSSTARQAATVSATSTVPTYTLAGSAGTVSANTVSANTVSANTVSPGTGSTAGRVSSWARRVANAAPAW